MSNQPSDDPFKETMLKKRDQSTRYKSIEEIFPILSNPKERKKYYGCSTGANLSQEILDFWTSALEKVHTEVFKSASVSYGDLLDYFKTKDGEMPSLKAYIVSHFATNQADSIISVTTVQSVSMESINQSSKIKRNSGLGEVMWI